MSERQQSQGDRTVTDSEKIRERIPRFIEHNTGGMQSETISRESLLSILSGANFHIPTTKDELIGLVESDDIHEENGRYRLPSTK